jgi:hypothetical protein
MAGVLLMAPLAGCAGPAEPRATTASAAAPADDPGRLIGLDAGRLQGMFGAPGLVRTDAPAEIWQYRTHGCVLDLFLYQDKDGMRLHYLEARDPAAQAAAATACVDAVMASRDKGTRAS